MPRFSLHIEEYLGVLCILHKHSMVKFVRYCDGIQPLICLYLRQVGNETPMIVRRSRNKQLASKCDTRERVNMELLLALGGFVTLFTMWVVAPKFLVKKSE